MHRSTYHALTPEKIDISREKYSQEKFDGSIERNINNKASIDEFGELYIEDNPTYVLYENNDKDGRFMDPLYI